AGACRRRSPARAAPARLRRAGALDSMTYNVVNVAGPALAGALAAAAGAAAPGGAQGLVAGGCVRPRPHGGGGRCLCAPVGSGRVLPPPRVADGARAGRPLLREGVAHIARTPP